MKEAFKSRRKLTSRRRRTLLKARRFKNRLVWLRIVPFFIFIFLQITNGSKLGCECKHCKTISVTFKEKKKILRQSKRFSFFFFIHEVNRCCIFCDTRTRLRYSSCSDLPRDTFRYGSVGLWVGDKLPLNEWAARPKLHHAEVWRRQRGTAQLSARGVINAPSFEAIPPIHHSTTNPLPAASAPPNVQHTEPFTNYLLPAGWHAGSPTVKLFYRQRRLHAG